MRGTFIFALVLSLLAGVAACKDTDEMDIYKQDQITDISAQAEGGAVIITVRPLMETAHYLAGAMLEAGDAGRVVRLVRCRLKGACPTDVPAEAQQGMISTITVPDDGAPLSVAYDDGATVEIYRP